MPVHSDWLVPEWPWAQVGALMSTRQGGVSVAPFDSLNLHADGADDPRAVTVNRARFAAALGVAPVFLEQVHGTRVVRLGEADALPGAPIHRADASVTAQPGTACTVQVADCLPVLFAAPEGRAVGAAHAGWRGLAGGVLEAALRELCALAECEPSEVHAWLGACIGPGRFEVGADVLEAFGADTHATDARGFRAAPMQGKWLADLPELARMRLAAAGVNGVSGARWCTVDDASRFFSFRRDRVTGRMAAAIWIHRR
jgi:polyphenol oxidase